MSTKQQCGHIGIDWDGKGNCIKCARDKVLGVDTKQQIEEILDYAETFYNDSRWEERERLNPTYTELEGKIDRLVTEARLEELDRLFTTKRINGDQIINQTTFNYILDREAQLKNNTTKQEEE